jgi:hypothetical protein
MTYEDERFAEVENVGFIDSVVRGSASIAIVVAVLLIPSISSFTLFGLTQLAIYAGLTAFIGWDPLYAVLKQSGNQVPAEVVRATAAAYPRNEEPVPGGDHKKAA